MYECSAFLAGYILYEPLDPPTKPPKIIFSPTETIKRHTGDCFDLATLLCSLLIGSGYDAYVVCGFAPRHITLRDQSLTPCPMLANINDSFAKVKIRNEDELSDTEESTYVPLDNSVKESFYTADQLERKRIEALDTFELWIPEPPASSTAEKAVAVDDLIEGEPRQHAWVMVCAGRREVKDNLFFEPSTGRVYSPSSSPYTGVEAVWNHKNFWVIDSLGMRVTDVSLIIT
jgi:transglutaminase-like putative cysteine protease